MLRRCSCASVLGYRYFFGGSSREENRSATATSCAPSQKGAATLLSFQIAFSENGGSSFRHHTTCAAIYFGGVKEESLIMLVVLFVAFPFPVFTVPYMIMALYLVFNKKRRVIDIPAIVACPILLLCLSIPSLATIVIFFLPFILFSTPFGLIALALILAVILIIILVRRRKKRSP